MTACRCVPPAQECEERARVVRLALEYEGTPYKPNQRVKGPRGGVDCFTLIVNVYEEAQLIPKQQLPYYSQMHHLVSKREVYIEGIERYSREISGPPEPGDLAVYKFGLCYFHAAIVIQWPTVIHAFFRRHVFQTNAETDGFLRGHPLRFFSFWEKAC